MDIRTVRKQFFDKKLRYACSIDRRLRFDPARATAVPEGVKVNAAPWEEEGAPERFGQVFHVLDQSSVEGVDDRQHDCPVGAIDDLEESILFHRDASFAETIGRMSFRTNDETTIELTFSGALQFQCSADAIFAARRRPREREPEPRPIEARAWLVPVFSTINTRFRWLSEHACVAFGTWVASPPERGSGVRIVESRLDVYSAG